MVQLDSFAVYLWMFVLAAVLGLIGGLGAELIRVRGTETGIVHLPSRLPGRHPLGLQLGSLGAMLIGAIAAVVVLFFFAPELVVKTNGVETRHYELVKFVALSLIAGIAGSNVLTAARSALLAQLSQQATATTKAVAKAEVENAHRESAKSAAEAAKSAVAQSASLLSSRLEDAASETPADLHAVVDQLDQGHLTAKSRRVLSNRKPPSDSAARATTTQRLVEQIGERAEVAAQAGLEDRIAASMRTLDALP